MIGIASLSKTEREELFLKKDLTLFNGKFGNSEHILFPFRSADFFDNFIYPADRMAGFRKDGLTFVRRKSIPDPFYIGITDISLTDSL